MRRKLCSLFFPFFPALVGLRLDVTGEKWGGGGVGGFNRLWRGDALYSVPDVVPERLQYLHRHFFILCAHCTHKHMSIIERLQNKVNRVNNSCVLHQARMRVWRNAGHITGCAKVDCRLLIGTILSGTFWWWWKALKNGFFPTSSACACYRKPTWQIRLGQISLGK